MKCLYGLSIVALAFAGVACDNGTSSDPKTVSRGDLNSPRNLVSVTGDNQVELRWEGSNAEDDFVGYHVFAVKKTKAEVAALLTADKYPAKADLDSGLPRCLGNTKLFEAFGFKANDSDCEGGAEEATEDTSASALTEDEATATDDEESEVIENAVTCDGNTDTTISLPIPESERPVLGQEVCVVKKAWNGTAFEDIENGETYTFFVTAVAGDDKSTISWTSNFIDDTPSVPLLSKGEMTIKGDAYYVIPGASLVARTAIAVTDIAETTPCVAAACTVNVENTLTDAGIYIGRLGSGNYPQRVFISTPSAGSIELQLRGPQTNDPAHTGAISDSIPGDEAIDATYIKGDKFPVYGNQVFDIKITEGSTIHYGKIVIDQPSLPDGAGHEADDMSVKISIIMQPQAGNRQYFQ